MKTTINEVGQKLTRGRILLKADTEMLNRANDGKAPWDRRWKQPSFLVVPAGTEVEYERKETRCGLYHTVSYKKDGQVYYASKKTDDKNYGN